MAQSYEGIFRAIVKDIKDPQNLRRIKVSIPQVTGTETTDWAWPIMSTSRPPQVGSGVYLFYIGGDPDYPVWIGEFNKPLDTKGVFSYGAWHSTVDQSASLNTATAMTASIKDYAEGIRVVSGSRFTVDYDGIYNLQFSAQLHHTGGGGNGNTVKIWLRKNGSNVADSNTKVTVQSNNPYVVAAWNFYIKLKKDDYVQLMWSTDNANIRIEHEAAGTSPAIPSVIVTMNQVA